MRHACVIAAAAAAAAPPPRGFLLVATNLPVQLLRRDADADWRRDELGCVLICRQQHNVEGARGGRAATPAPTYCGTTTARSARSTSRRGRRRAATTRRRTNWSCGTSTTATLLRHRRRGNFLEVRRPQPVLRHLDRSIETRFAPGRASRAPRPREASGP